MQKKAFTLIELVITIVIVGIVSLSFPLIMAQTSKNVQFAIQQEAVLAAKTYIGTILSYPWDENIPTTGKSMILETDGSAAADSAFERVTNTNLRIGNIDGIGRRRMVDASLATKNPSGNINNANPVDIDDFDGKNENLAVSAADLDYMFSLTLSPQVSFVTDSVLPGSRYDDDTIDFGFATGAVGGGTTNIRMVAVEATSDSDNTIQIVLRAYSANIGEVEILKRRNGEW
jgi:prepilin-type N-terminal cleavage/methylation domain-containing protein